MGHSGKNITSNNVALAGHKCSPLCRFQDKDSHVPLHWECFQDYRKFIQSIGQHLPAQIFHLNLLMAHLGDPQIASQQNVSSHLQNCRKQILQGLEACLYCLRCHMTIIMEMMKAMIGQTCAVHKTNCPSAWNKPNSLWSNLPLGCSWPTTVYSTSGRKYGKKGFGRRSISPLTGSRGLGNRFKMDLWTGRKGFQMFLSHSIPGCGWILLILLNWFAGSGLGYFWTNVHTKFGRRGKEKGEEKNNRQQIWASTEGKWWEVTSPSFQIPQSWLWFARCQMASI